MVVVDRFTKYAHFCALSHQFKACIIATAFLETIQKLQKDLSKSDTFSWKNDCYGTKIAYKYVRIPNSNKRFL